MTQKYYPFDSGAGANVTREQWTKMAKHWLKTGVLSNLMPFADSTGMQVKVPVGYAWIEGHYYENDLEITLPIASANSSNPRIDRIVLQLDWVANVIQLAVLQGVAAVSPVPPALTQNFARWEIPLAQVTVSAGVTTIATDKITDERQFVRNSNYYQEEWHDLVLLDGWVNTNGGFTTAQYMKDEFGFVHIKGVIQNGNTAQGSWIAAPLPVGYRPDKSRIFTTMTALGASYSGDATFILGPDGVLTVWANVQAGQVSINLPPYRGV